MDLAAFSSSTFPPCSFFNRLSSSSSSSNRSSYGNRTRKLRAALVEARPPPPPPRIVPPSSSNNKKKNLQQLNLVDDLQAEARAMARAVGASVYSPQLISIKYGSNPVKVVGRTLEILFSLGFFAFKLFIDQNNGQLNLNKRMRAIELRNVLTNLGPTFVKIGQGLSTRPDLCPSEYLEELSELQDALPTFPNSEAFSCIEKELELPLDSIYSSISPSPIAAASLGQVYKAQLKYSGHLVAVKVQRPRIEDAIGLDFYLIRGLGSLINKYVSIVTTDVVALIDEFARRVYQELNYVQEGQNARRFKKLYADKEDVLVPDIFWDYTSGKVLTMDWVNRDYEAMARDYYALDFLSPDVDVSPIVPALRNFFDDALNSTVSELNFKTILYQYPFNGPYIKACG